MTQRAVAHVVGPEDRIAMRLPGTESADSKRGDRMLFHLNNSPDQPSVGASRK
jgi:hypothetical protein